MKTTHPIIGDLVLVGGGHAQISVLRAFAMKPLPGLRLTLVANSSRTPYSGMLPGYVEGVWQDEELHIDLRHRCSGKCTHDCSNINRDQR